MTIKIQPTTPSFSWYLYAASSLILPKPTNMMCMTPTMKAIGIIKSNSPIFDCNNVYPRPIRIKREVCVTCAIMKSISDRTSSGLTPLPSYLYRRRCMVWNTCATNCRIVAVMSVQITGCTKPALSANFFVFFKKSHMKTTKPRRQKTFNESIHLISQLNSEPPSCAARNSYLTRCVKFCSELLQSERAKYHMWGRTVWLRDPVTASPHSPLPFSTMSRFFRAFCGFSHTSLMLSTACQSSSR
mmetsp:Transcript_71147/g.197642  ORF Transcript_71147/g.197642 Transcript_71147/m.197642 type:complete len:243 (+) Transcript_71147:449-1177(+)